MYKRKNSTIKSLWNFIKT